MRKPTQFQLERAAGIGGSDAPVLCGVARWRTPLQLWAEKVAAMSGVFEKDDEDNDMLLWGTLMEPQILKQFGKKTKRKIYKSKDLIVHPDLDWLIAHLDGTQLDKERGIGVVEGKNVSRYVSDRWAEEVPVEVQIQTQHYLAATGHDYATAVGLVGGHQLIWQDIERNQGFIDDLLEREERFWMRVLADNPPTATAADHKFLNALVQVEPATIVQFDGEGADIDMELQLVLNEIEKQKEVMQPLDEKKKELEARIKQMIGSAEEGHTPAGQVYTFKEVVVKETLRKEYRFRKLVRKKR